MSWEWDKPARPLSPHRSQRLAELMFLIWTMNTLEEAWTRVVPLERDDVHFLTTLTHWFCTRELPDVRAGIIDSPPLLSGRPVPE